MKKTREIALPRQRSKGTKAVTHRLNRLRTHTQPGRDAEGSRASGGAKRDVVLDCGWGRLLFAQTFSDDEKLLSELREEAP